ncbi:DUF6412 domain-containing protein [Herbiconiux daphne]|uniref:DUF6412 domain-containing protein n=1 Tax=Herbiconiux daphne TaxID=2970914 RepID=A0ABT2H8E6_9MICO|nr:DUF6412 domain-containing protein [Herbiconiux daphne]MCS5736181.1 DUF6412 domain-containing protein [Herbiconiux daphne]
MGDGRVREGLAAAARVVAVGLGVGFVWMVSSSGDVSPGVVAALAVVAGASLVALTVSSRVLVAALVALAAASVAGPPAEPVELPATITQSRPDAPGRPQPRAPGRLLAAA